MREKEFELQVQTIYLCISLFSTFCVMTNFYVVVCSNVVGCMCFIDLFIVKKKDMMLHHLFVLSMLHYMNCHPEFENRNKVVSIILSTEISTIFLIINNLLNRYNIENYKNSTKMVVSNINRLFFVSTFMYYRVYKYYYFLISDEQIQNNFVRYSRGNIQLFEIFIGVYGLFILNLYWTLFILIKLNKSIKCCDKTKNM